MKIKMVSDRKKQLNQRKKYRIWETNNLLIDLDGNTNTKKILLVGQNSRRFHTLYE